MFRFVLYFNLFEHADSMLMIDSHEEGTCNIIQKNLEEPPLHLCNIEKFILLKTTHIMEWKIVRINENEKHD